MSEGYDQHRRGDLYASRLLERMEGMGRARTAPPRETEERFNAAAVTSFAQLLNDYGRWGGMSIDQALRASCAWACVSVLSGSAAILPVDAFRSQGDERLEIKPQPTLVAKPSALVERDVWIAQVVTSMYTDGNLWAFVGDVDRRGVPISLETIDPEQVTDRKVVDGQVSARVSGEKHYRFPYGDLWHVPGPMVKPGSPFGESPVRAAAGSLGSTFAAEQFSRDFFEGGGHPSSIIYSENADLTATQARDIKSAYLGATQGREPAVMGSGLKVESIQIDPTNSQFLDLLRFQVENQCRYFRVPPSMVYAAVSGQSVTYANVSEADLAFLKHSLQLPLTRLERAWSGLLARDVFVRCNRDAILAADTLTRFRAHSLAIRDGWKTRNEVRSLEDMPRLDDPEADKAAVSPSKPQEGP